MGIFKQLGEWQYYLHLLIIDILTSLGIFVILNYEKISLDIGQWIQLFIFLYLVIGVADVAAHFLMNLIGWKD